jgi:dTDP-4-dehydrorhamnose reductase
MKILVTGADGQLGQELFRNFKNDSFDVIPLNKMQMDITNYAEVNRITKLHKPDWIVNCAAYTNVDLAQQNVDKSNEVNTVGPGILAQASADTETKLLHISTDAVFSSQEPIFFEANSKPNPVNQYGRSKDGGEKILLKNYSKNSWIIRTSWLYGEFGGKFVRNVLGAIKRNSQKVQFSKVSGYIKLKITAITEVQYMNGLMPSQFLIISWTFKLVSYLPLET